jgi:hypothetical protein
LQYIPNDKEILVKKILESFLYRDGGGKRKLRDYVKVALFILVLVISLIAVGAYNRYQMVSQIMAAPRPLDTALIPTPTEQIAGPISQVEECPSNPANWTLNENVSVPGSNLKRLAPQCVYDQLEKIAAWYYATSVFGYSRKDAATHFGFSSIPMAYKFEAGGINVITDFNSEPQKVTLRFPSDNTGLKEWRIDANGRSAVQFTFTGCFRTSSMSGAEVVPWGDGYPVICQYSGDFQTRHYISDVNGKTLTISGHENLRRLLWFGYAGDGRWVFLGIAKDWEYDLSQIRSRETSTISLPIMATKYGVDPRPLPENWSAFTGQEFVDAFLEELDVSQ